MAELLIDANVILSARNANSDDHTTAKAIFDGIDQGELPRARVLNYVVPEILHPIQKRISKSAALKTLNGLQESRGFIFEHVPEGVHPNGEHLFRLHESSSGPEWVDSLIAAYMHAENIEYIYSFDDDFDTIEEISRLNTPVDPFSP
jgi:predicted nucleic acid-binding protein